MNRKIEKANLAYNKVVLEEFMKNQKFREYSQNFSFDKSDVTKDFVPATLKPRFNTPEQILLIKKDTEAVLSGLNKIERAIKDNDTKVINEMCLTEQEVSFVKLPKNYINAFPFCRIDAALNDNYFKLIEINLNFPGGPGVLDELHHNFIKLGTIAKMKNSYQINGNNLFTKNLLRVMMQAYRESGRTNKKPNILILRWNEYDFHLDTKNLSKYFNRHGFKAQIADPREVTIGKNGLNTNGFEADLVLKWFDLDIFIERFKDCQPLYKAIAENKVVIVNPLSASVMATKTSFAVMSNPKFSYLFNKREIAAFKRCIPWTRMFGDYKSEIPSGNTVNLANFAKANRTNLVLKPAVGTCGKRVIVGAGMADGEWQNAIRECLKDRFILQERVEIMEEYFPVVAENSLTFEKRRIDILPMLYNGKFACSASRSAKGYILNGYQGGILAVNFTIKERK